MMKKTLIASSIAAGLLTLPGLSAAEPFGVGGFLDDAKASLDLRNLYFDGDYKNADNTPGNRSDREWGQGFMLKFNSGYTAGPVGFGVDVSARAGLRLDSGNNGSSRKAGELFPTRNNGKAESEFSQLDLAGKARLSRTELVFGRGLQPNLPVIRTNDGRLLPQTYSGTMLTSNEISNLTLRAGQLDEVSGRNWQGYRGMQMAGGNQRVNKFQYLGGDARLGDSLVASYYFAKLKDYYNQHFLGAVHTLKLGEGQLITDLRFFDSDATGANSNGDAGYQTAGVNNNGEVDNQAISAMFTYKRSNYSAGLGYQTLRGDSNFAFLNNGDRGGATAHLITDSQIGKFLSAGENTWVGQYSYNFADYVPGLSFTAKYLYGKDADAMANGDAEWERDLRLDYKVQSGLLKDLGLSLRHASLRSDIATDKDELRVYLTYSFALL